jgi:hypothetical protein
MTRWRVGWLWWVVALTLPPAMVLAAAVLNTAAGAPAPALAQLARGDHALLFRLYLINPLGGRSARKRDGVATRCPGSRQTIHRSRPR